MDNLDFGLALFIITFVASVIAAIVFWIYKFALRQIELPSASLPVFLPDGGRIIPFDGTEAFFDPPPRSIETRLGEEDGAMLNLAHWQV